VEEQVLKEAEELERENARLKKIVPGQVLGREPAGSAEKSSEPGIQAASRRAFFREETMLAKAGLPTPTTIIDLRISFPSPLILRRCVFSIALQ